MSEWANFLISFASEGPHGVRARGEANQPDLTATDNNWTALGRLVEADELDKIRTSWNSINYSGDDKVSLEEMYVSQLFDMADKDKAGK